MTPPANRHTALIALAVVVALSLCANLWLSARVNDLQQVTAAVRADLERAERALQDQISGVAGGFAQLERELAWVKSVQPEVDPSRYQDGLLPVEITWTLAESQVGAAVTLIYHPEGRQNEAREVRATARAGLGYRAEIAVDPTLDWQYRIVARKGEWARASDTFDLSLRKLSVGGLMLVRDSGTPAGLGFQLRERPPAAIPAFRVAGVSATYRTGETWSDATVTPLPDGGGWKLIVAPEATSLRLKFVLAAGMVVETEIERLPEGESVLEVGPGRVSVVKQQ